MSVELTSPAFQPGATIPTQYTGDGADRSLPLAWSDPPAGTASFALICDDPDAPRGTWVHWVLFDLPGDTRHLDEGVPTTATLAGGAEQGVNDFGNVGYGGPAPPKGKSHRYFFKLYALDLNLDLPPGATKGQVLDAMPAGRLRRTVGLRRLPSCPRRPGARTALRTAGVAGAVRPTPTPSTRIKRRRRWRR